MSSGLLPVALYGVEVPPGEIMVPAAIEFPATVRISCSSLDSIREMVQSELEC